MSSDVVNQTIFSNLKQFVQKEVNAILDEALSNCKYDPIYTKEYVERVCEQVVSKLTSTNRNFKYITNCVLLPKGGHGLQIGGLCHWDSELDGAVAIRWENQHMHCIMNVYGIAI